MTRAIKRLFFLPPNGILERRINGNFTSCFLFCLLTKTRLSYQVSTRNGVRRFFIRRKSASFRSPNYGTFINARTIMRVRFKRLTRNFFIGNLQYKHLIRMGMATRRLIYAFTTRCRLSTRTFSSAYRRVRKNKNTSDNCIMDLGRVSSITSDVRTFLGNVICLIVRNASVANRFTNFGRIKDALRTSNRKVRLQPPNVYLIIYLSTFNNVFLNSNESSKEVRSTARRSAMKSIKRRLTLCNNFGYIIRDHSLYTMNYPTCQDQHNVAFNNEDMIILRDNVIRPITNMPTIRLTLTPAMMITKGRELMLITRALGNFRLATRMSISIFITSCVGKSCTSKITNSRMVIHFFVVRNRNRSTIRLFRRTSTFIFMGNGSSFTIKAYLRNMFSNVTNASITVIMGLTVSNGRLFTIK